MNTIEDRLRDALTERASHSPLHPGAWEQTLARTRPRPRSGAWARYVIPAAAAAAVVAIVAAATVLTGHRGLDGGHRGGGPSQAGTAPVALPAPLTRKDYLIQQDPPVSQVVKVKAGTSGQAQWVYVWFARMKGGQGTVLCSEVRSGKDLQSAYCETADLFADQVAVPTGGYSTLLLGASGKQVASVRMQLPGHVADGQLISGRGFPAKVWLASFQPGSSGTIVFRDANGHQVGQLALTKAFPSPARPRHGGITVFRSQLGTATAYLIGGRVCIWSTAAPEGFVATLPASAPPALSAVLFGVPPFGPVKSSEFYGYAHGNVAQVTLRLASGKLLTARTIPGWPGSGIRFWAVPGPAGVTTQPQFVALAYDAAGRVVGQVTSGLGQRV